MIDEESELKRFKWILLAGVLFLVSCFLSYTELKYAIRGKTAEAQINDVREVTVSRRRGPEWLVEYTFTDTEKLGRTERDSVAVGTALPESGKITVQYLPGVEKSSRIAGRPRLDAILFFFGSLLWLAWSIFRLAREANTPIKRDPGRRSR